MTTQLARRTAIAAVLALGLLATVAAEGAAAPGIKVSDAGIQVWTAQEPFRGDLAAAEKGPWETVPAEQLPRAVADNPVLVSATQVAALDAAGGRISLYTRQGDRLTQRATLALDSIDRFSAFKLVRGEQPGRLGVEVFAQPDRLALTLYLSADGIVELKPGAAQRLSLRDARIQYGIVPSFVGTDLVYTAKAHPALDRLCIPSMGLLVGLVEGEDCTLVAAWARGEQAASLNVKQSGQQRSLDGFSIDMAGKSLYLACLEGPRIWHAEALKPAYLEKDTPIGWQRPFEAKWIGRFRIASEGIAYPFYFRHERMKMWGRCIRGWFYYPVWFDGDKTILHFEKPFPPKDEMLIYYLEGPARGSAPGPVQSPVGVMEKVLGREQTARLLDFDGVEERPLLRHGCAVCEMTAKMLKFFDDGQEAQHRAEIESFCKDVADFIRMIRDRINEFGAFTAQMRELLAARAKDDPRLAQAVAQLQQTLAEMDETRTNGMPGASLEDVRQWTDEMSRLAAEVRTGNNKKYDKLAAQCRSVAGSQDDLARDLSILGIRLTEEAASLGVQSPEHAKLAQQVIAQTRQVLRKPTWWEPRRHYLPKSDPGRP